MPEYSFLEPRGMGIFDGKEVASVLPEVSHDVRFRFLFWISSAPCLGSATIAILIGLGRQHRVRTFPGQRRRFLAFYL